jgi:hypothetical protein
MTICSIPSITYQVRAALVCGLGPVIFLFIRHKKGAKQASLVGCFGPGGNA